ncbi:MAG: hypothetical protein WCK11_03895 [Candidatus Falkowbacteria bacterium]
MPTQQIPALSAQMQPETTANWTKKPLKLFFILMVTYFILMLIKTLFDGYASLSINNLSFLLFGEADSYLFILIVVVFVALFIKLINLFRWTRGYNLGIKSIGETKIKQKKLSWVLLFIFFIFLFIELITDYRVSQIVMPPIKRQDGEVANRSQCRANNGVLLPMDYSFCPAILGCTRLRNYHVSVFKLISISTDKITCIVPYIDAGKKCSNESECVSGQCMFPLKSIPEKFQVHRQKVKKCPTSESCSTDIKDQLVDGSRQYYGYCKVYKNYPDANYSVSYSGSSGYIGRYYIKNSELFYEWLHVDHIDID